MIALLGRSVSATATLSATYLEIWQGDHIMWLYEGVPQSKPAAAGKFAWNASIRAPAGNLATTAGTIMMTRNKFICATLLLCKHTMKGLYNNT